MTDNLIQRIKQLKNPTIVGLDTSFDYLPNELTYDVNSLKEAADAIITFNQAIIQKIKGIVPAVKVQVAYYEMYGVEGMRAFAQTLKMAKEAGLIVCSDVKRNDIGSTATCYSNAYIGKVKVGNAEFTPFESDFITINPYLGQDGINPFVNDCKAYGKGIFVLCKTSNPSSGQLQDKIYNDGNTLYETVADLIEEWGKSTIGQSGYSSIGAVVGATYPKQSQILRQRMPHTMFLVPGYGAQGATASDLLPCFDKDGQGAVVNSSRGILCAYKSEKYKHLKFDEAAKNACIDMQKDLITSLHNAGKML